MKRKQSFSEEKTYLTNYNMHRYALPLATVDMTIFSIQQENLSVLLIQRNAFPQKNQWALPGGFIDVHQDKNLLTCAMRKLKEKTGINTPYLEQVGTVGNPDRDPRGWSITVVYFALIDAHEYVLQRDSATEQVIWLPITEVFNMGKLAFDHMQLLHLCYERLRTKVQYTSLPLFLLAREFTLSECQKLFEIILQTKLEKKSFRRRLLDAQIVQETGYEKMTGHRPATLYRLRKRNLHYFPRSLVVT